MDDAVEEIKRKMLKDLRTGLYALIALNIIYREGPIHGYGLIIKIRKLGNNVLSPSESTVYETLKYLEKKKLIRSYWSKPVNKLPRKYYEITELGKSVINEINKEVRSMIGVILKVLNQGS